MSVETGANQIVCYVFMYDYLIRIHVNLYLINKTLRVLVLSKQTTLP